MVITNQKEYDEELKKFKKEVSKLTRSMKLFFNNPAEFQRRFEELMDEGVKREVISKEYSETQKKRLLHEITQPTRFNMFAREKIEKLKRKLKLRSKDGDK